MVSYRNGVLSVGREGREFSLGNAKTSASPNHLRVVGFDLQVFDLGAEDRRPFQAEDKYLSPTRNDRILAPQNGRGVYREGSIQISFESDAETLNRPAAQSFCKIRFDT